MDVVITPNKIDKPEASQNVAVIRTTDRAIFKNCRRRWDWSSHLRQNYESVHSAAPLWMGTMMHYALEELYGKNTYGSAAKATDAYTFAFLRWQERDNIELPAEWVDTAHMCKEMMHYYETIFAPRRDKYTTLNYNGNLQVEVNVKIEVPFETLYQVAPTERVDRIKNRYEKIFYSLQFDRVALDEHGQLWIVEYKSAKSIQTSHYLTDPQITTYLAAAHIVYGDHFNIGGVLYQQHKKTIPKKPERLKSGKISVNKSQVTSHALYKQALLETYGDVASIPEENVNFLNMLAERENTFEDAYVRRDLVTRSVDTMNSFFELAAMEIVDMLDPELLIYPNLTRDCANMCSFWGPCVAKDDGNQHEYMFEQDFKKRQTSYDVWRDLLPDPNNFTWKIEDAVENQSTIKL